MARLVLVRTQGSGERYVLLGPGLDMEAGIRGALAS